MERLMSIEEVMVLVEKTGGATVRPEAGGWFVPVEKGIAVARAAEQACRSRASTVFALDGLTAVYYGKATPAIGLWKRPDGSAVEVGEVDVFEDRQYAYVAARARRQFSVYDLTNQVELFVPASGKCRAFADQEERAKLYAAYLDRVGRE
jgi:hypothetical protein